MPVVGVILICKERRREGLELLMVRATPKPAENLPESLPIGPGIPTSVRLSEA
jgi:hypothetical protein